MNNILIVDSDRVQLEKMKTMLIPFQEKYLFTFLQYPEEAMDILEKGGVDVVICELDMPVMSGRELFDMLDIVSPDTVKIAMNQVVNVEETLNVMNENKVFKLILKPFRLVEDIMEPLEKAIAYKNMKSSALREEGLSEEQVETLKRDFHNLKEIWEIRAGEYLNVYHTVSGIVMANVSGRGDNSEAQQQQNEQITAFLNRCFQEYMADYIISVKSVEEHKNELKQKFHQSEEGRYLYFVNEKMDVQISDANKKMIKYAVFLMAALCAETFSKYRIGIQIEDGGHFYKVKILCEGDSTATKADETVKEAIYSLTEKLLDRLFVKNVLGMKENPYAAIIMVQKTIR